jgi:DNA polymerase-3 subunit delta
LVVGEDSYLRTQYRERIIAAHVPEEARAFAVAQFSLGRTPLPTALSQAATRPMLSPRQVLVLSDVEALSEEDLRDLEHYLAAPADFTVLIFEAERLDRRTRVARLLLENCELYEAESPDDQGAVASAARFSEELAIELDRETAEELVFALGSDQGRLYSELAKLRAYVGEGGRVTSSEVAALVSRARQFSVFDLVDLLAERRRGDALARLRQLLEGGESPIGIVGLLAWLYRQLLQAQALPRGTPGWKAAQSLRAPRSRVEALLRQASKFSPQELRAAFAALLEADVALKSSPANPTAVLEMLVVRLTSGQVEARS